MKIIGKVENANSDEPISGAKIELTVDETELATLYTDEKGYFEHNESDEYIGMTLLCKVEKEEFESTEIRQDIDDSDINIEIELLPVFVPPVLIKINGTVTDFNSEEPLEGAVTIFRDGAEIVGKVVSGKDGSFLLEIGEEYLTQQLEYEVTKSGYRTRSDVILITAETNSLDIRLKSTEIEIPLWLGLKSKRKIFIYSSIGYFIVLFLLSAISWESGFISTLLWVIIPPITILSLSRIILGYLSPSILSLIAFLNLWYYESKIIESITTRMVEIKWRQILFIAGANLVAGMVSTYYARKRAFESGIIEEPDESKTLFQKVLGIVWTSLKHYLFFIGALVIFLTVYLMIKNLFD